MQPRKRRSGEENSKLNVPDFFLFSRLIPWSFARNSLVDIPLALDPRAGLVSMQITQLRDSNTGQITPFRPRTVNLFFRLFFARFYDLHGKPAPNGASTVAFHWKKGGRGSRLWSIRWINRDTREVLRSEVKFNRICSLYF